MADFQLTNIPEYITAGDAVTWTRTIDGAPASAGWSMTYALVKADAQITFASAASGDDHLISLTSSETSAWSPGQYAYQAYVSDGTNRYQIDDGVIEIRENYAAAATGADVLPSCFKVRDAIIAVLEMRASESQTSIAVAGRQISEMSHTELMDGLNRAETACALWKRRNRRSRGLSTGARIKVSFRD